MKRAGVVSFLLVGVVCAAVFYLSFDGAASYTGAAQLAAVPRGARLTHNRAAAAEGGRTWLRVRRPNPKAMLLKFEDPLPTTVSAAAAIGPSSSCSRHVTNRSANSSIVATDSGRSPHFSLPLLMPTESRSFCRRRVVTMEEGRNGGGERRLCPANGALIRARDYTFDEFLKVVFGGFRAAQVPQRPLNHVLSRIRSLLPPSLLASSMALEFGVFQGATMAEAADALCGAGFGGVVAGFDSFEGLPTDWRRGLAKGSFGQLSYEQVRGRLPPSVELRRGWFQDTLPPFLDSISPAPVSYLHLDGDLFVSAAIPLQLLSARIVPGTLIGFDELVGYPGYEQHEALAAYLWMWNNEVEMCTVAHHNLYAHVPLVDHASMRFGFSNGEAPFESQSAFYQVVSKAVTECTEAPAVDSGECDGCTAAVVPCEPRLIVHWDTTFEGFAEGLMGRRETAADPPTVVVKGGASWAVGSKEDNGEKGGVKLLPLDEGRMRNELVHRRNDDVLVEHLEFNEAADGNATFRLTTSVLQLLSTRIAPGSVLQFSRRPTQAAERDALLALYLWFRESQAVACVVAPSSAPSFPLLAVVQVMANGRLDRGLLRGRTEKDTASRSARRKKEVPKDPFRNVFLPPKM